MLHSRRRVRLASHVVALNDPLRDCRHQRAVHQEEGLRRDGRRVARGTRRGKAREIEHAQQARWIEPIEMRVERASRMKASVQHRSRWPADSIIKLSGDEQQRVARRLKIETAPIRITQQPILGIGVAALRRLTRLLVNAARQHEPMKTLKRPILTSTTRQRGLPAQLR